MSNTSSNFPKALYMADLPIGNAILKVAVLDNEQRIISETSIAEAMLGSRSGAAKKKKKESEVAWAPLPVFLAAESLKPFISNELKAGAPFNYLSRMI
jgi:hypothetical protein